MIFKIKSDMPVEAPSAGPAGSMAWTIELLSRELRWYSGYRTQQEREHLERCALAESATGPDELLHDFSWGKVLYTNENQRFLEREKSHADGRSQWDRVLQLVKGILEMYPEPTNQTQRLARHWWRRLRERGLEIQRRFNSLEEVRALAAKEPATEVFEVQEARHSESEHFDEDAGWRSKTWTKWVTVGTETFYVTEKDHRIGEAKAELEWLEKRLCELQRDPMLAELVRHLDVGELYERCRQVTLEPRPRPVGSRARKYVPRTKE